MSDLRYALRTLANSPGFTAAAVLTLALGIGANSAIFSVVDAALLRPLPFPGHERLVVLEHTGSRLFRDTSPKVTPDIEDFRDQQDVFEQVADYLPGGVDLAAGAGASRVRGARVTPNFFATLGARPALGRLYITAEEQPPAADVAILSDGLWRGTLGGDSAIVGKTVTLNERPYVVVGVMPLGFSFPQGADLWLPLTIPFDFLRYGDMFRNVVDETIVARLRAGVTLEAAQARVAAVGRRYLTNDASGYQPPPVSVVPLRSHLVGDARVGLLVLMGAVVCVLLIASANVASLALARAATRRREIALRAARTELRSCLSSGGYTATGESKGRLRSAIVVVETALATVLLVGAGLMLKSLSRLQVTDTGIEAERLLTANISLPSARYRGRTQLAAFFRDVMAGIRAVPGVRAAGAVNALPLGGESSISLSFTIEGRQPSGANPNDRPWAEYLIATPGYFRAMGILLVAGRDFADADDSRAPPVAVINETMGKRLWTGSSPLSARFRMPFASAPRTIVGVVHDVRSRLKDRPGMQVYLPLEQEGSRFMTLAVRAGLAPSALG